MAVTGNSGGFGKRWGVLLAIAVGLVVWYLPLPGVTLVQHKLLAIFAAAIILWISMGVNFAVSTLLIVVLLYFWVGNPAGEIKNGVLVRSPAFAVSGFGNPSLWLLVTGFIISIAMMKTGVARRVALLLMKSIGRTPNGSIAAMMLANLAVAPLTPSNTARTALFLPLSQGIADAYGARPPASRFGKALSLSVALTSNLTGSAFLTGTIPNPVALGMLAAAAGASTFLTWGYWCLAALPTNLLVMLACYLILTRMFPAEMKALPGGAEYVHDELRKLGPMSGREKRAIAYFILALLLWATDQWHHLDATMVAFLVSTLILMPKIGVLDWSEAEKSIPWELFVYFGGVLTLSSALDKSKAFAWVMEKMVTGLGIQGMSMMTALGLLMGLTIFSHVIWCTTTAMTGVMMPIYIGLAKAMGWNVISFGLPMAILMAYALFLPFNTMGNIIMFGTGHYTVKEQAQASFLLGAVAWGLWVLTAFTWWRLIGLL